MSFFIVVAPVVEMSWKRAWHAGVPARRPADGTGHPNRRFIQATYIRFALY
jgi:hypothetical protein